MLPLFAFLDDAKQSIMQFVHNCLLVAGAFLVGYILGGIVGWALGKWALKQESPQTLKQMGRPVGGIILAFIVALLVFSGMGKRWGPGGDGAGTPSDTGNKERTDPSSPSDPHVTPPKVDLSPVDVTVRVIVQAGTAVRNEKYYLINDDPNPRSLTEAKEVILALKSKSKGRTMLQVLLPSDPNLGPKLDAPSVKAVTRWAIQEAGLDVTFPASR